METACLNCRRPNTEPKFRRCPRCREVARAYASRNREKTIQKSREYRSTHRPELAAAKREYRRRKRLEKLWERYSEAARALIAALTAAPCPILPVSADKLSTHPYTIVNEVTL
jgi:hypothetical protein